MVQPIRSQAFEHAALRSERYRIWGLLAVFGSMVIVSAGRAILWPQQHEAYRTTVVMIFLSIPIAYELVMLALVRRAEKKSRTLGGWVWVINTIVEGLIPTVALLGLTVDKSYYGPYRALTCATVQMYSFFIILSALRLRPWLCILSGTVSAAGYAALYAFTLWAYPNNEHREQMPPVVYIINPVNMFLAGLIAAGVAFEIRRHVIAALAEAETRRKLDRVEHDLQIARTIQMGLLPKSAPAVAGYDIAGWSQPAEQTGGDYYDWMELPGGKIIFTVADATGHGIGPALLVAACRAYFRAVATNGDPLEKITAQVDALLASDIPEGRFITAAVALLEPAEHRLSLYSAGHAPLYFYRAKGDTISAFDANQPPLGLQYFNVDGDSAGSQARVLEFLPGDALVLVTDGLFECANAAGEQLGTERLGEAIRVHQARGAEELIKRLHAHALDFAGPGIQADDLTAVVIRRV